MSACKHEFRDSNTCAMCGVSHARLLLDERKEWVDTIRDLQRELAEVREAWANQLVDLIPRIGLRALVGVPEEVTALLALKTQGDPDDEAPPP